jgi:hypothetical protein
MNLILVDPPKLRQAGRAFKDLAERARALGREVLKATQSAPSYDGDFGPRVRSGGVEVYAHYDSLARLAEEAADFLLAKADEFEAADQAGQAAMASVAAQMRGWTEAFQALLGAGSPLPAVPPPYQFGQLSLEDFEAMTVDERIAWVRAFNEQHGGGFFFNFVDVLYYFKDSQIFHGLDGSTPASEWMSWGDAGALLVVQDGYLLFRDPSAELAELAEGTPPEVAAARRQAAESWAEFFNHLKRSPEDTPGLRQRWSVAEQSGIDYATSHADLQIERSGLELTGIDRQGVDTFVRYGDVYRWGVPPEHGVPLVKEAPGAFGEIVGQSLGQDVEDRAQRAVEDAAYHVEQLAGKNAGEFVERLGNGLVGENSPLGPLDEATGSAGSWVGERVEDAFEGPLDWLGEKMFDPRVHLGVDWQTQTPLGPLSLEAEVRGPVYHLSMAIEGQLLQGNEEAVKKALEGLEQIRTQVDGGLAP